MSKKLEFDLLKNWYFYIDFNHRFRSAVSTETNINIDRDEVGTVSPVLPPSHNTTSSAANVPQYSPLGHPPLYPVLNSPDQHLYQVDSLCLDRTPITIGQLPLFEVFYLFYHNINVVVHIFHQSSISLPSILKVSIRFV